MHVSVILAATSSSTWPDPLAVAPALVIVLVPGVHVAGWVAAAVGPVGIAAAGAHGKRINLYIGSDSHQSSGVLAPDHAGRGMNLPFRAVERKARPFPCTDDDASRCLVVAPDSVGHQTMDPKKHSPPLAHDGPAAFLGLGSPALLHWALILIDTRAEASVPATAGGGGYSQQARPGGCPSDASVCSPPSCS